MLLKEFRQMLRDVRMRLVIFVFPVVQLTVMAFAMTTDVKQIPTLVVDEDQSAASRQVADAFRGGTYFRVVGILRDSRGMADWLDQGRAMVVLHFPAGFEGELLSGRSAMLQIIADGTYNNDTAIIQAYAQQVLADINRQPPGPPRPNSGATAVELAVRAWYNPNLDSKFYYVPCLMAVMLLIISMLLTSIAVVREKEIGTIEQIMVTPIRRVEFILGKTLPFLIIALVSMTMMLIVAIPLFDLPMRGNMLLLYALAALYIIGNLGIALLVSISARTQQQAMLTTFLILMPAVLLSGFIFPIRNMPEAVQLLTYVNPVRWFLLILQGIMIRGVGVSALWPEIGAQAALASVFVSFSVVRFKKTLQ
jgi:ABC-2 type transport system permease protein